MHDHSDNDSEVLLKDNDNSHVEQLEESIALDNTEYVYLLKNVFCTTFIITNNLLQQVFNKKNTKSQKKKEHCSMASK